MRHKPNVIQSFPFFELYRRLVAESGNFHKQPTSCYNGTTLYVIGFAKQLMTYNVILIYVITFFSPRRGYSGISTQSNDVKLTKIRFEQAWGPIWPQQALVNYLISHKIISRAHNT